MKTRPKPNAHDVKPQIDFALWQLHEVEQFIGTKTDIAALDYSDEDYCHMPVLTPAAAEWIRFAIESGIVRMHRRVIAFAHHYAQRQDAAFRAFVDKCADESDQYLTRFMARLVAKFGPEGGKNWLVENWEPSTEEQNRIIVEYYNKAVKALTNES